MCRVSTYQWCAVVIPNRAAAVATAAQAYTFLLPDTPPSADDSSSPRPRPNPHPPPLSHSPTKQQDTITRTAPASSDESGLQKKTMLPPNTYPALRLANRGAVWQGGKHSKPYNAYVCVPAIIHTQYGYTVSALYLQKTPVS